MRPEPLASILDGTAEACRLVDDVGDWTADDRRTVLDSIDDAVREESALSARIRALLAGQKADCDDPPDLNGQCLRCGRTIAAPVAGHKRGCLFAPVTIVARAAVRVARYGRSISTDLRGTS